MDAWIELWTERALAQDVTPRHESTIHELLVLSHPDFEAAVRQGFKDLRRPDLLARNPLLRTRLVRRPRRRERHRCGRSWKPSCARPP